MTMPVRQAGPFEVRPTRHSQRVLRSGTWDRTESGSLRVVNFDSHGRVHISTYDVVIDVIPSE